MLPKEVSNGLSFQLNICKKFLLIENMDPDPGSRCSKSLDPDSIYLDTEKLTFNAWRKLQKKV
jgi:hypothetical protein